jgi:hypothetical protein
MPPSPTQLAKSDDPCGLAHCAERSPVRLSAAVDAARFDRDAPSCRRVAASGTPPAAGHAPSALSGGVPLPRDAGHVAWSGPFRRRSVLGFPSRDQLAARRPGRPQAWFHACDGVAFDAFPDGTRGVSDVAPFAGLLPPCGCVACRPPTRTHVPFAGSTVAVFLLRDRPARSIQMGASVIPGFSRRASSAANVGMMTNDARRVGRSRMGWFGFWVLSVPPPAIRAPRRSSCSRCAILPWAFASFRCDRCEAPL